MKILIGFITGVVITYLFGALVGVSFNPTDWHWVWRLIVAGFSVFWGLIGASIGWIAYISDLEGNPDDDT